MAATGSVPAGTRVGRYEIVSLLRQGGMGEVYTANDSNLGRRVALKILPKNRTGDPDRVARFVREARASSTLNHPAIVSVHDAGSEGDVHYLAMELIDGLPLSDWMKRRRTVAAQIEVMAQVAEGLAQAHDAGIIHRDLKPDNIMVTSDGRAKIVDFGVAKLTERTGERSAITGVTTPTSRVGTTAYMAPEQIEGKALDHRADVFAFGIVLYELLAGANPFASGQYADTIHNVVHLEPALDAIPQELRRIVRRCLRKEPGLRYDSLRDAALDLREAAPLVEAMVEAPRRRLLLWGGVAVALAVAIAAGWLAWSRREQTRPPAMTMTRLTNSGRVVAAAISPDGKYLVHAVKEADREALYVKQIATGTMNRIAEAAPVHYVALQVSPDGNYVYYTATARDEPNVAHIWQLPLLGGAPRRIAADTEFWFSVSPDGKRVVFRRFSALVREHQLTLAAVDGGGEEVLLRRKHPQWMNVPVWSPDGASITYAAGTTGEEGKSGLQRLMLATREVQELPVPRFPGVSSYGWLPDGSGLLVAAFDVEQPPQIWYVPAGDTTGRKVTSEVSAYSGITPTADSRSFSAVREVLDSNILTLELAPGRNGAIGAVTSGFGNWVGGGGVRWLNDREVVFSAFVQGSSTFLAVDAAGGTPRRLIHNLPGWNVTVSPDGSRIAFVSDSGGTQQIWTADASGANPRRLTDGGHKGRPAFTPDGRSIVYLTLDDTQYAWRVPADGSSAPVQLTKIPTSRAVISPDGRLLLARLRSNAPNVPLWRTAVVAVEGGQPRYFDAPRYGGTPNFQWHPDGKSFLYVDQKDGVANLWQQELAGGEPKQVTFFDSGDILAFDLSRDGRRVVLGRGESTRDAVLIRDFR